MCGETPLCTGERGGIGGKRKGREVEGKEGRGGIRGLRKGCCCRRWKREGCTSNGGRESGGVFFNPPSIILRKLYATPHVIKLMTGRYKTVRLSRDCVEAKMIFAQKENPTKL